LVAEVRLICKSTSQRNVTQRHAGLKHVLSGVLQPPTDHECVRRLSKCALEDTRKMGWAETD
jgi:hypothetical protein